MPAKIAYINYYYDRDISLSEYFIRYPSIPGWCNAITGEDFEVNVYQRFNQDLFLRKDKVTYNLINDGENHRLKSLQRPEAFHEKIIRDKPDLIHVNSLDYVYQAYALKKKSPSSRIIIQHHAEKAWKGPGKIMRKYFSKSADGFIFSSKGIYDDWISSNALPRNKNFAEITEGSTFFSRSDRKDAKSKTDLNGNPVFLWVGRLNSNKDPLTVISGFQLLLKDFPLAKLYMIYSENDLEQDILSLVSNQNRLNDSVQLLGKINHTQMQDYYNSADYFVLGSHYEGSGYSLIEAIACGVVPIVTDIPSFKTITCNGKIGGLWKAGNAESFYQAAKKVLALPLNYESEKTAALFKSNLSYEIISQKAKEFYKKLLNEK